MCSTISGFYNFANDKDNLKGKTLSAALMLDTKFDGADLTEVVMFKAYAVGACFKGNRNITTHVNWFYTTLFCSLFSLLPNTDPFICTLTLIIGRHKMLVYSPQCIVVISPKYKPFEI